MNLILTMLSAMWQTLCAMAPYILFGFLAAGLLSILISPRTVERQLGRRGFLSSVKAALFGIPLPLCSCSVIPVTVSLRKHGASKAAATSFLLSAPQTGVDSIFVTYSLLGPVFAVFRPIIALFTGIIGGAGVELFAEDTAGVESEPCQDACCTGSSRNKLYHVFHYGFVTLARDIAKPLLAGIIIAGGIAALVPEDYFSGSLGDGLAPMIVMLIIGIPMYVCSTASVPIAASLIVKGLSPGAALVFLVTGAATNAAGVATVWKILGRRTALIFLGTVAVSALGGGLLLDFLLQFTARFGWETLHHSELLPGRVKIVSAVVLLGVLGYSILSSIRLRVTSPCGCKPEDTAPEL